MSSWGLVGQAERGAHRTHLGLCRGGERKETPGTAKGSLDDSIGYAVVRDCGAWVGVRDEGGD